MPFLCMVPEIVRITESPACNPDSWLLLNVAVYVDPERPPDVAGAPFKVTPLMAHCDRSNPGAAVIVAVIWPTPAPRRLIV